MDIPRFPRVVRERDGKATRGAGWRRGGGARRGDECGLDGYRGGGRGRRGRRGAGTEAQEEGAGVAEGEESWVCRGLGRGVRSGVVVVVVLVVMELLGLLGRGFFGARSAQGDGGEAMAVGAEPHYVELAVEEVDGGFVDHGEMIAAAAGGRARLEDFHEGIVVDVIAEALREAGAEFVVVTFSQHVDQKGQQALELVAGRAHVGSPAGRVWKVDEGGLDG